MNKFLLVYFDKKKNTRLKKINGYKFFRKQASTVKA